MEKHLKIEDICSAQISNWSVSFRSAGEAQYSLADVDYSSGIWKNTLENDGLWTVATGPRINCSINANSNRALTHRWKCKEKNMRLQFHKRTQRSQSQEVIYTPATLGTDLYLADSHWNWKCVCVCVWFLIVRASALLASSSPRFPLIFILLFQQL